MSFRAPWGPLGPPNDSRGFVHKRIIGAARGFLTTGSPLAAVSGFVSANTGRKRTAAVAKFSPQQSAVAGHAAHGHPFANPIHIQAFPLPGATASTSGCRLPSVRIGSRCINPFSRIAGPQQLITRPEQTFPGGGVSGAVGEAVVGQYGAALVPGSRIIDRAVCLPGMVLGTDSLCYNSYRFPNRQRMWPRGRKPLLTGGEMRAISIASRAATRLTNTAQRMHEIGLLKKPITTRRRKKKA